MKPLWYLVKTREVTFETFKDNFIDPSYGNEISSFVLNTLYNTYPYINEEHILKILSNIGDAFPYFYIYWTVKGNEPILEDYVSQNIKSLPYDITGFNYENILSWIVSIMLQLFDIFPEFNIPKYTKRDKDILSKAIAYKSFLDNAGIHINLTVKELWRLDIAHGYLKELFDFLVGKSFPSFLDESILDKVVNALWPEPLSTMNIQDINIEYDVLEKYDYEFISMYVNKMKNVYDVSNLFEESPEKDAAIVKAFLMDKNPEFSRYYLTRFIALQDDDIEEFADKVKDTSFSEALEKELLKNKEFIDSQVTVHNKHIVTTQIEYWKYSVDDLIFHKEDGFTYVFLKNISCEYNPFTRKKLPNYCIPCVIKSIPEQWEDILKHSLDIS